MAKKPILTEEFSADALSPAVPHVTPPGATRPVAEPSAEAETDRGGRDAAGHARPKTRILGYTRPTETDATPAPAATETPPVGWLVVTGGAGRGATRPLRAGMNAIGRGDETHVQLDFGDTAISRAAHAYVTYDAEARRFFLSHAGKTNIVRLNDAPVLESVPLDHGDSLRVGETCLRFVALCGPDFDWAEA
ncbi:FHA domain-containing protein [Gymnodinialimonas ceratoperidinii]|uniref:FHA domain-containing protein n=1 Tax=Gymnodinialimonas ceratoperidinii TaxID=2856823 RepID=A0A8F6Y9G0_9RHOB|nr:FHA domain-containing protein [Gymnodinialimonas ceratoperidinii]QXT38919.1 FHA domain-containing protein [Gymnodinialimonas ceratoperidinii]